MKKAQKALLRGFFGVWFMADFVGDGKNGRKIDSKKVKWGIEAYHCLLLKNTWFRFFSAVARRYA